MAFTISSPAFRHENAIPSRFTCEGDDVSPALHWSDVPKDCRSLALIVEDPDAPDPAAPKRTFAHWVVFDIPPDSAAFEEATTAEQLPPGAVQGKNDFGKHGFGGPCPPIGRHRYYFKLYALDDQLKLGPNTTRSELLAAIEGHVIAEAVLMGTYQKHDS